MVLPHGGGEVLVAVGVKMEDGGAAVVRVGLFGDHAQLGEPFDDPRHGRGADVLGCGQRLERGGAFAPEPAQHGDAGGGERTRAGTFVAQPPGQSRDRGAQGVHLMRVHVTPG